MAQPILQIDCQTDLAALSRAVPDPSRLLSNAARGVSNLLIRHLLARNQSAAHRPGFPRSNYWATAARSVQTGVSHETATVSIHAPGIALHYHGGVVRPVAAKRLAIPLRPEVADKNPREGAVGNLFVIHSKRSGKAVLAGRGPDGRARAYWLLLASTTHLPDPSVLPPPTTLRDAALRAAK